MIKKLAFSFCLFFAVVFVSFGQKDSTNKHPVITLSGSLDTYYAYDFSNPSSKRQDFLFNFNRHNEFNVNIMTIKVAVKEEKYRANLALHTGTYAQDNYAAEEGMLKNIYEANAGFALDKKNKLWLDAGIFSSHLGFEDPASIDNVTLTRSLCAENSPYFLSGAKLTYYLNDKWELSGILSNGWQRIKRVSGNSMMSGGTQVIYNPNSKMTLNWSSFVTTEDPDTTRRLRIFNDIYGVFELTDKWNLTTGFDYGLQQQEKSSSSYNSWYVATAISQYKLSNKVAAAIRLEYFHDPSEVIIISTESDEVKLFGASINLDYSPIENVKLRVEYRLFNNNKAMFRTYDNSLKRSNSVLASSLVLNF